MQHGEKSSSFLRLKDRSFYFITRFLSLLFPIRCVNCDSLGARICSGCIDSIQWLVPPFCKQCGLPGTEEDGHACIDAQLLRQIRSASIYSGSVRKALHALKYRQDRSLADLLVEVCLAHWPISHWKVDCLVPVPMGSHRFRERGYNQAELLAQSVARKTGIPLECDLLWRNRDTRSQVGLPQREREINLANAFTARSVDKRKILLIDDICTTGSTLQACAKALKDGGASVVFAATIARTVVHQNGAGEG